MLSPELIRNIAIIYVLCVLKHPQFTALEKKYRYGKINIGMPVFMDDIATAGKAEHIRKGIKNCARMEKEKKISFGLKKTKYMIVKTGREEEEINETVKAGRIQGKDKCS